MKLVIFCLLVSFYLCYEEHVFRYKNGTFTKGNKSPITISGSLYLIKDYDIYIIFVGMDYSTMSPLTLIVINRDASTTGIEVELDCLEGQHEFDNGERLSGTSVFTGSWDKSEFNAECYTRTGDRWVFKSSNVKSETIYYSPKEAGLRAKLLIDQYIYKYNAPNIITFAVLDYSHFVLDCDHYLSPNFPEAPGPEPGAIMVGKDEKHCAILDNEGTKFIQSNPVVGKVTYDSLAVAKRYFPNGILYKRYPKNLSFANEF